MKKIMYLRSGPYEPSENDYNLQEVGLLSEFCNRGYDCDLYYYGKKNHEKIIFFENGKRLKIEWIKGIRLLRSGVYPRLLNEEFLNQYDAIICSEYSQIMTIFLSRLHRNVYCYNGPYYNLFKIPFFENVYDYLFVQQLEKNIKMFFCKSQLSEVYLKNKGLTNTCTVGVGQNINKFSSDYTIDQETKDIVTNIEESKIILYVGSIDERKNFSFLLNVFEKLIIEDKGFHLLIIGKGKDKFISENINRLSDEAKGKITIVPFIKNTQLKYIYSNTHVFLLPSKLEIFGMVILEAMTFGLPVISSSNGGSNTVIRNEENGFICDITSVDDWVKTILKLNYESFREKISKNAMHTIYSEFTWSNISELFLGEIEKLGEKNEHKKN